MLRRYSIVRRESQWHMMVDGQEPGLIRHDNRDFLVAIASDLAATQNDSISIYKEDGQISFVLRFRDGAVCSE
jgi:hypothetical protein